jgi:hypothetical protein
MDCVQYQFCARRHNQQPSARSRTADPCTRAWEAWERGGRVREGGALLCGKTRNSHEEAQHSRSRLVSRLATAWPMTGPGEAVESGETQGAGAEAQPRHRRRATPPPVLGGTGAAPGGLWWGWCRGGGGVGRHCVASRRCMRNAEGRNVSRAFSPPPRPSGQRERPRTKRRHDLRSTEAGQARRRGRDNEGAGRKRTHLVVVVVVGVLRHAHLHNTVP